MTIFSLITKRFLSFTCVLFFTCAAHAQCFLGTRESSYLQAGYLYRHHWQATGEFSVFSDLVKRQYARLYLGYDDISLSHLSVNMQAYYGTSLCQSFYNLGIQSNLFYLLPTKTNTTLTATLNPAYDSDLQYETFYAIGVVQHLCKAWSLRAEYTTIPEYRMSEHRIRVGFQFRLASNDIGTLQVSPLVSIPLHRGDYAVRLGIDSRYYF